MPAFRPAVFRSSFHNFIGQPQVFGRSLGIQQHADRFPPPVHPDDGAVELLENAVDDLDPVADLGRLHDLDVALQPPQPIGKFQIPALEHV